MQIILFYKIIKTFFPLYLQEILSSHNEQYYQTKSKSGNNTEQLSTSTNTSEFLTFHIAPRNGSRKLKAFIPKVSKKVQKKKFLSALDQEKILSMQYVISDLKLLTRLRLNFSHLNQHKVRRNFKDSFDPMSSCDFEPEKTDHYFLRCKPFSDQRTDLLNIVFAIDQSLEKLF